MRDLPISTPNHEYGGTSSTFGLYILGLKRLKQPVCIPTQDITEHINTRVDPVLRQFLGLRS